MEDSKNVTLTEATTITGLSQGRISQLIHGYLHKAREERYLPVLKENEHWLHEMRGRRMYTVLTPEGIEVLKGVKSGEIQQKKETR